MARNGELRVHTPEGVTFSFLLASPLLRALARGIDLFVIIVTFSVLRMLFLALSLVSAEWAIAFDILAFFLLQQGYAIVLEYRWQGQTLGKRAVGLRVLDARGLPASFPQIVVRNLLRVVDVLPGNYGVGGLVAIFSPNLQRLGDIAAGTVVVRVAAAPLPDPRRIRPDRFNTLRQHPAAVARLRQAVTPEEARLAYRALLRRDELEPEARLRLFRELADHFQGLAPLPPEATESLSPEALVRNIVDTLLESRPASAVDFRPAARQA